MNKKNWLVGVAVVVVVVVLVAISLSLRSGTGAPDTYRIGAILPLTGRAALLGENVRNGMELAAEDINARGGINGRTLEITFGDSRNDPKEGVSLMNRFTSVDRLPAVVSAMTPITAPLLPIAERHGTVLFATMVSSPEFANRSTYLFRCFTRAATEVPPLAALAYEQMGLRNIVVLFVDDDFGQGYADAFKGAFEKPGGKVVGEIPYPRGGSDFRNTIVKLKSMEMDGIYLVGYDRAMGLIPKQIREMGIDQQILANASAATPAYTEIAGEAAEGITLMNFAFSTRNPRTEEGKRLVERYREKFGDVPLVLTVIGYDMVGLLAKAIETRGASADQIRDGLLAISNYDGVIGKLTVQSDGEVDVPLMPLAIRGGRPTPFAASPGG
jgi:branched-chain amino acid transport system substrate-binding protein